jgi:transcriptional regulator with XRE-family HTH domain
MVVMAERSELGDFLRSRRERLAPEAVGLPGGTRRRTPGLRREELAMLAGISVDYLVRLEQGRETNPSTEVLASLAKALRLDEPERMHLGHIGKLTRRHVDLCPMVRDELSSTTMTVLDRLDGTPAFVMDVLSNLLVWNDSFERLYAGTGMLDGDSPNLLRFMFLDPQARDLYRDWDHNARELAGNLRYYVGWHSEKPEFQELVGELSVKSTEFAKLWSRHDVGEAVRGEKAMHHPVAGDINLNYEVLFLPDHPQRRLVVQVPADAASAQALDDLLRAGQPADGERPPLRVVGGTANTA